jgi:hypothetical protein
MMPQTHAMRARGIRGKKIQGTFMLQATWLKCKSGDWCSFSTLDLGTVDEEGIYIIWHTGNPSRVVYVGQGDVASRIRTHRTDSRITQYAQSGTLKVTWAAVSARYRDGIERYLADKWSPLVGDAHPEVLPLAVNSPW